MAGGLRVRSGAKFDLVDEIEFGGGAKVTMQGRRARVHVPNERAQGDGTVGVNPKALFDFMAELAAGTAWVNTGGHLASAPSYNASTRVLTIPFAAPPGSTTDPLAGGSYLIGAALRHLDNGQPLSTADWWELPGHMVDKTASPTLTSDCCVVMGYVNEAADSGTIDGVFWGLSWTGSARSGIRGRLVNGAVTGGVGGSDAGNRAVYNAMTKYGNDLAAASVNCSNGQRALTNSGANNSSGAFATTDLAVGWSAGLAPRPFLAVYRTSTGDANPRTYDVLLDRPANISVPIQV